MKIRASITTHSEVDVEPGDLAKEAANLLRRKHKIDFDWIDQDGLTCTEDEHYHGSYTHTKGHKASEHEVSVWSAIKLLENYDRD